MKCPLVNQLSLIIQVVTKLIISAYDISARGRPTSASERVSRKTRSGVRAITERFEWSGELRSTHTDVPVRFSLCCLVRQGRSSFILLMEKKYTNYHDNFVRDVSYLILITELFKKNNPAVVLNANGLQPC